MRPKLPLSCVWFAFVVSACGSSSSPTPPSDAGADSVIETDTATAQDSAPEATVCYGAAEACSAVRRCCPRLTCAPGLRGSTCQ